MREETKTGHLVGLGATWYRSLIGQFARIKLLGHLIQNGIVMTRHPDSKFKLYEEHQKSWSHINWDLKYVAKTTSNIDKDRQVLNNANMLHIDKFDKRNDLAAIMEGLKKKVKTW